MQASGCVYPGQLLFTDLEGCALQVTYNRNATAKTVPLCHLVLPQDMKNTQSHNIFCRKIIILNITEGDDFCLLLFLLHQKHFLKKIKYAGQHHFV